MHSSLRTCIQYLHRQEGQVSKTAPNNNYDEEDIRPTINKNLHNMRAVVSHWYLRARALLFSIQCKLLQILTTSVRQTGHISTLSKYSEWCIIIIHYIPVDFCKNLLIPSRTLRSTRSPPGSMETDKWLRIDGQCLPKAADWPLHSSLLVN